MNRLDPTLWNLSCGFYLITNMTSPGRYSGFYSPSPLNTIFYPSFIPFSMEIFNVFCYSTTFLPWHLVHYPYATLPFPPHLSQCTCICIVNPIPACTVSILTPCPWHLLHTLTYPSFAPVPLQIGQITFFFRVNSFWLPLYNSSRDTWMSDWAFGPFW